MLEYLPESIKPEQKKSNAKELVFNNEEGTGLDSKIKCMTAGGKGIGRSDTFTALHLSELALMELHCLFYPLFLYKILCIFLY